MNLKNSYYWFKSAISPEDCKRIMDIGIAKFQEEESKGVSTAASTYGDSDKQSKPNASPSGDLSVNELSKKNINDVYVRDSHTVWLNDQWIYDLVRPLIHEANQKSGWNWEWDAAEMFQFTKYNVGGFYGWHDDGGSDWNSVYRRYIHGVTPTPLRDNGNIPQGFTDDPALVGKVRKISMTINLNPPGEYEGGDLKFDAGLHVEESSRFYTCEEIKPQGSVIIFPSFIKHCVTPVTQGTRYSLVLWTLGKPWK
jgi:PKHD-type hydroxylase